MRAEKVIKDPKTGSLNPYYTGSTLWDEEGKRRQTGFFRLNPYYTGSTLWDIEAAKARTITLSLNPYYTGSTLWELSL